MHNCLENFLHGMCKCYNKKDQYLSENNIQFMCDHVRKMWRCYTLKLHTGIQVNTLSCENKWIMWNNWKNKNAFITCTHNIWNVKNSHVNHVIINIWCLCVLPFFKGFKITKYKQCLFFSDNINKTKCITSFSFGPAIEWRYDMIHCQLI